MVPQQQIADGEGQPYTLPAGLSPDSIDIPSELATILSRIHYVSQPAPETTDPSNPRPRDQDEGVRPKDLPTATDSLKHKIQRARAAVHTLPDIKRTIPEQEAEIAELKAHIEKQRAALGRLKEYGLQFAAEETNTDGGDVEMGGTGSHSAEGASG
ncbi:hypothetical protein M406DRAFT_261512 [Cryphonectria parasitica EP155]|uniref:Mediator of RNA polymerase II transcription subunit 9 n=1 Tax=Cryphonectria parasitica (strain ATCC 38755 / EP155) TaxID=660469 RepID=A0A9P4XY57_CRYP1|nr:uncharacterized protein M406DRAFT_261512 [Cryphonectria parasitica EP155]KAF3763079.1 hypothetical protein M406DRAFT_261512 [Cryphonectria parasitica EP155]